MHIFVLIRIISCGLTVMSYVQSLTGPSVGTEAFMTAVVLSCIRGLIRNIIYVHHIVLSSVTHAPTHYCVHVRMYNTYTCTASIPNILTHVVLKNDHNCTTLTLETISRLFLPHDTLLDSTTTSK